MALRRVCAWALALVQVLGGSLGVGGVLDSLPATNGLVVPIRLLYSGSTNVGGVACAVYRLDAELPANMSWSAMQVQLAFRGTPLLPDGEIGVMGLPETGTGVAFERFAAVVNRQNGKVAVFAPGGQESFSRTLFELWVAGGGGSGEGVSVWTESGQPMWLVSATHGAYAVVLGGDTLLAGSEAPLLAEGDFKASLGATGPAGGDQTSTASSGMLGIVAAACLAVGAMVASKRGQLWLATSRNRLVAGSRSLSGRAPRAPPDPGAAALQWSMTMRGWNEDDDDATDDILWSALNADGIVDVDGVVQNPLTSGDGMCDVSGGVYLFGDDLRSGTLTRGGVAEILAGADGSLLVDEVDNAQVLDAAGGHQMKFVTNPAFAI